MRHDVLVQVETSRLLFALSGPSSSPLGVVGDPASPAILKVSPGRRTPHVDLRVRENDKLVAPPLEVGPWLFEETDYQLELQGPQNSVVTLQHRDPTIASQVTALANHPNLLRGTFRFRSQVGT